MTPSVAADLERDFHTMLQIEDKAIGCCAPQGMPLTSRKHKVKRDCFGRLP